MVYTKGVKRSFNHIIRWYSTITPVIAKNFVTPWEAEAAVLPPAVINDHFNKEVNVSMTFWISSSFMGI
jgi:hypothetical protein